MSKSVIHCQGFNIAKKYLNSVHFPYLTFCLYENFAELKYLNQMKFRIGNIVD